MRTYNRGLVATLGLALNLLFCAGAFGQADIVTGEGKTDRGREPPGKRFSDDR